MLLSVHTAAFTFAASPLFATYLYDFSGYMQTLQALYAIILGKISFVEMEIAQP